MIFNLQFKVVCDSAWENDREVVSTLRKVAQKVEDRTLDFDQHPVIDENGNTVGTYQLLDI